MAPEPNEELETLRTTVAELRQKATARKQRITELETSNAALQTQLTEATKTLHDVPLKQMAESLSKLPELWLEQFQKHWKVESIKGVLTLLDIEGKPVLANGKPVPFDKQSISKFVTEGEDARSKLFQTITTATFASGAGGSSSERRPSQQPTQQQPGKQFGLR